MMKEYELLMWTCINQKKDLLDLIKTKDSVVTNVKQI